ncbi:MAG: 4Fe-4S binding protein, partial [Treponema sp.]|nr:4Fe-4S binding protein [Treponema sp.]
GQAEQNCISCGECRRVCPVGLDPEEIYKKALVLPDGEKPAGASECHGCGCCEVVCPSRLPLSELILGKIRGRRNA